MKKRLTFVLMLIVVVVIILIPTQIFAFSEVEELYSQEDINKINYYTNVYLSKIDLDNIVEEQSTKIILNNGDQVEISMVTEEIIEGGIRPYANVEPGKSYRTTITKNRTGFLSGSLTTSIAYRTTSGNNNITMTGTSVTVNATPANLYTIVDKNGYFTRQGPARIISAKSYATMSLIGGAPAATMSLDVTLTGGYNSVNITHVWNQG